MQSERDQIGMAWDDSKRYAKRCELKCNAATTLHKDCANELDRMRKERDTLKKALELASDELWNHCVKVSPDYFIQQAQEEKDNAK